MTKDGYAKANEARIRELEADEAWDDARNKRNDRMHAQGYYCHYCNGPIEGEN